MIILALSVAAMLVTGSFIGRRLARAREESSVEFRAPEPEVTAGSGIPGRRQVRPPDRAARAARVASMD